MKLAVLMDPIESIKPYKDSSFAMLLAAQEMGWTIFYFTLNDMYCEQGQAMAQLHQLKVMDNRDNWFKILSSKVQPLAELDCILMRKDPPFDMEYIYATYALELAQAQGVKVLNKPQSLRDANEKFFTLAFPQCCPPTLVSRNIEQLKAFHKQHEDVVYKPLDGMGGRSIFRVSDNTSNLSVILETLTANQTQYIMAQVCIDEISVTGDKRILLIDGEPIDHALARIPAQGELRGNLAAGARGEVVAINERDRWLCQQIAPTLKQKGLLFVGIDVIGDYITEINVTSPTCIREIEAETKQNIAQKLLEKIEINY